MPTHKHFFQSTKKYLEFRGWTKDPKEHFSLTLCRALAIAGTEVPFCHMWKCWNKILNQVIQDLFPGRGKKCQEFNDHPDTTLNDIYFLLFVCDLQEQNEGENNG